MPYIMIIDDDVEIAEDLSVFLEDAGHTVKILNDTEGAIKSLVEETGRPRLAVDKVGGAGDLAE